MGKRSADWQIKTVMPHRCGTVAIIGRPNVGKSTLLNRLLGQKIAIVSPKPETTRERLLGILTLPDAQILFLDTPGIYRGPKTLMAKKQILAARDALSEADAVLMMTEAHAGFLDGDRQIAKLIPRARDETSSRPAFLAINKVDRVRKELILPQIDLAQKTYPFRGIFPMSAMKGENVQELLRELVSVLPEGPALYPADQVTDRPVRQLAQEIIREKTLLFTHEEVPHAVAVLIEEWRKGEERAAGRRPGGETAPGAKTYVRATLYVERDSQKGILIGKDGGLLKKIGQSARVEIEDLVGGPVYLDLWIKVAKNWRRDSVMMQRLGYS